MSQFELEHIIDQCKKMHKLSQQLLFEKMYSYGHHISMRYTHNNADAEEVLSSSFLKVFLNIHKYDETYDFVPWFKKIVVNTAIDFLRLNKNTLFTIELTDEVDCETMDDFVIDNEVQIMPLLQKLSPMYQMVFNLYIMEEYSHDEIGLMLGISASTSRSNLTRAKAVLKKMIIQETHQDKISFIRKLKFE